MKENGKKRKSDEPVVLDEVTVLRIQLAKERFDRANDNAASVMAALERSRRAVAERETELNKAIAEVATKHGMDPAKAMINFNDGTLREMTSGAPPPPEPPAEA